jgi:DNA helicase IV
MGTNDRLTVISIGVGIVLAITAGACSTNARIADLRADMNARFADVNARFAEASEQRREEHRRIDERLDRLEEILLKPAPPNAD